MAASQTFAEPLHPGLTDRWQFDFTVLSQEPEVKVRATKFGFQENTIDLQDLGVDDRETTGQIGVRYHINEKWRANFGYTPLDISGTRITDRTFNFDGEEFPLSSTVSTDLELKTYIFALDYAFHTSDTSEWGVGAGLHAIDLDIKFEGSLNDLTVATSEEDFLAPLPNLRVYMKHAINERWLVGGSLGWLGIEIDKYDGDLLIATAFIDYRINDNWTLGASYQAVDIDLTIDDSPKEQAYDIKLPGIGLNLTYSIPR